MAKFLTRRGTAWQIENIINNAKRKLVLVCPFVKIPDDLFQGIKTADKSKVEIVLVYGKNDLNPESKKQLVQVDNLSLYFHKSLHAKCFFNEELMVITSMNLYEYSERNKEMGILINRVIDKDIYLEATNEVARIIGSPETIVMKKVKPENSQPSDQVASKKSLDVLTGHCIRCRTSIPLDLEPPYEPYCLKCYADWKELEDPTQREKFCHLCGKLSTTNINHPLCRDCYRKSQLVNTS